VIYMADIMTVRQFGSSYRRLKPGTSVVVVDGCRRKVLAAVQILPVPAQVAKNIKVIYTS